VLRSPARVLARQKELRAALLKRGVSEKELAERSLESLTDGSAS
jgi:hypothetical protein